MTELAIIELVVVDQGYDDGDSLIHFICDCATDVALCGAELEGDVLVDVAAEDMCIVCLDLNPLPCPRCGEMP